MPIYEYLCPDCHRIYSFLVRRLDDEREPRCPRCGARDLRKQISRFAVLRASTRQESGGEGGGDDPLDDPRVEREMMRLMQEIESVGDDEDPRQIGRIMRRMHEISGEPLDERTEEAIRRLEAGEDPERVEEDLGDVFDGPEGPGGLGGGAGPGGLGPPSVDEGLYEL